MSFVLDQVRRIDAQLDRLQLANLNTATSASIGSPTIAAESKNGQDFPAQKTQDVPASLPSKRVVALQTAIRGLSPGNADSTHRALLRPYQIQSLLSALSSQPEAQAAISLGDAGTAPGGQEKDHLEHELEWLLVSKATAQVYGHVLSSILDEAVRLSDDIWYWDEVLGSQRYTALYSIQVSPLRLWAFGSAVWADAKERAEQKGFGIAGAGQDARNTVTEQWKQFYGLVRQVVKEKSVKEVNKQILSPVMMIRSELRAKQSALKKVRVRNANALGVLLGEGLANESGHSDGVTSPVTQDVQHKWRASVSRNVALMEAVLAKINDLETPIDNFDSAIAALTDEDPLYTVDSNDVGIAPQAVAERLSRVLTLGLGQYWTSADSLKQKHGRPSRLVRYWLPITVGVISSSTLLRVLVNRQAEILQWVQDLGATVVDFWQNWVVEPTRNVIRTIRHDEGSEISIMSKRSLEGDRESLERMVVDFAVDVPASATETGNPLTDTEIADIRAKVREGDLTPVLKAYEKDLSSPLKGAVRGNLIRALLIQVQKTKVDVEIAMGGIDSLLKSQELLIGFISLTPGLLVAYGFSRWIRTSLTQKRGTKAQRKHGVMLRQLRNIDRILTSANATDYGELQYKDQGLLLCEVHVLRQAAVKIMPSQIWREFGEEMDELCDVRKGVQRQKAVLGRVRWAYGRWLS
ncbi:putative nuclear control of ATP synthase 2 [Septoria linicola]|nr:putative nuclear control of ATP synthase 2 [Septoria linicola]